MMPLSKNCWRNPMSALEKPRATSPREALKVYECGPHDLLDHQIKAVGYDLVLVPSEAISSGYGLPTASLLDLHEMGQYLERLSSMTRLPMIACMEIDGEAHARETTAVLQGAGMAGMYIDDRRLQHFAAAEPLFSTWQVVDRIQAVKEAQQGPDFMLAGLRSELGRVHRRAH